MKKRKAPSPHGISNKILTIFGECWLEIFFTNINLYLRPGVFPKSWREQFLALLRKEAKSLENPSSYRPSSILDTRTKFLKKWILSRLETDLCILFHHFIICVHCTCFLSRSQTAYVDANNEVVKNLSDGTEDMWPACNIRVPHDINYSCHVIITDLFKKK